MVDGPDSERCYPQLTLFVPYSLLSWKLEEEAETYIQ